LFCPNHDSAYPSQPVLNLYKPWARLYILETLIKKMGSDNCGRLTSQSLLPGQSARLVKESNLLIFVRRLLFFVAIMDTYFEIFFFVRTLFFLLNLMYLTGYSLLVIINVYVE